MAPGTTSMMMLSTTSITVIDAVSAASASRIAAANDMADSNGRRVKA